MAPTPRLVNSLVRIRDQVNKARPNRNKDSDGWIGDVRHQAGKSDHNPDERGLVYALDITNDPANGVVSRDIAEALRLSKDPRLQYVISNGEIANMDISGGAWRPYTGANKHDKHCHISTRHLLSLADNVADWKLPASLKGTPGTTIPKPASSPATKPPTPAKPSKPSAIAQGGTAIGGAIVAGTVATHASVNGFASWQIFLMLAGIAAATVGIVIAIRKHRD